MRNRLQEWVNMRNPHCEQMFSALLPNNGRYWQRTSWATSITARVVGHPAEGKAPRPQHSPRVWAAKQIPRVTRPEAYSWHDRRDVAYPREERPWREADQEEGEGSMKETTQAKITASVAIAKAMAQKALAPNPNPQWTEYEMRSIDEWIARQGAKLDRPEAIRRLVEIGLKAKK
jgi:hypothetical protein